MLVGKRMQHNPVTITKEESVTSAARLMEEKRVRSLLVVEGKKLVGIVSHGDIRQVMPSPATSLEVRELHYLLDRLQVGEIMTTDVVTVAPDSPIEDAARLMHDRKIRALPVVSSETGELMGIITETDVLAVLIEVMGLDAESARLELVLEDKPGVLADVTRVIKEHNVNIVSLVTAYEPDKVRRLVALRLKTSNLDPIIRSLKDRGYEVSYP